MTEHLRGHPIEWNGTEYVFSDTKESTIQTWKNRPCGYCGRHNTPEGHDGCLGTLQEVMNACCGHGSIGECYVQYWDGSVVRGMKAVAVMDILRGDDID